MEFEDAFRALTGHSPFPWQQELFKRFTQGEIPSSCSLPTGLGKTNVMAVWLIALAHGKDRLPRRLVYVVNRRTVVDQATDEARKLLDKLDEAGLTPALKELCAFEHEVPLAISTLRGQLADNGEWTLDPARPAIVVGTVDMVGSRLLFSGYRIGFKSRPLHAGFLGQDALLIHDEAHLEPAFQKLIEAIQQEQDKGEESGNLPWPKLRVMQLTATTRDGEDERQTGKAFGLTSKEQEPPEELPEPPTEAVHNVWRRLKAKKRLALHKAGDGKDAVAKKIAELAADYKDSHHGVLVFVRRLDDISVVERELDRTGRPVVLLTGTMRGKERDKLVDRPEFKRFFKGADSDETVYLVCTSAGEVGIDISADHMVCDLSTFESMAQRFGRVNRFGDCDETRIDVVYPREFDKKDKLADARKATLELLQDLEGDASPLNLGKLDPNKRSAAFAPEPTILPATDILFDAWALTSIRQPMPGRPPVEPYLHGIAEWAPPETYVAWREEVEIVTGDLLEQYPPEDLLGDYPLKPHELLRDRTDRVFDQLQKLAEKHPQAPAWIVDATDEIRTFSLSELANPSATTTAARRPLIKQIQYSTILLPPSAGGLAGGLLDGTSDQADDVADHWLDENRQKRRTRLFSDDRHPDGPSEMALIRTIDTNPDADEFEPLELEARDEEEDGTLTRRARFWHWYARPRDAEDTTSASTRPVTWDDHTNAVVERTTQIVSALKLPDELKRAIILAAKLHDLGKKREQWQRSIGNPNPAEWYAKPGKPTNAPRWQPQYGNSYRHEFGSLLDTQNEPDFQDLDDNLQDVVLHLVAASHGRGRPHFPADEGFDPNKSQADSDGLTCEVPRRFARLQRRYGRWGLAYLESLLRAADWAASAEPSAHLEESEAMP